MRPRVCGSICLNCNDFYCLPHSDQCGHCSKSFCMNHISNCTSCGRTICDVKYGGDDCLKQCSCGKEKCNFCRGTCLQGKTEWVTPFCVDIWRAINPFVTNQDARSLRCTCTLFEKVRL